MVFAAMVGRGISVMPRVIRQIWVASLRNNWALYLVVILFLVIGMGMGVWSAGSLEGEQVNELQAYITTLFSETPAEGLHGTAILKAATFENLVFFGAVYFAGLSVIGAPVMLALIFVRGFALGFAASLIIGRQGLPGILLACASLLPQNIILLPAMIFAGVAALSFSLLLVRRGFNPRVTVWSNFLRYTAAICASLSVAIGSGLVEAFVSPYLLRAALAVCWQ